MKRKVLTGVCSLVLVLPAAHPQGVQPANPVLPAPTTAAPEPAVLPKPGAIHRPLKKDNRAVQSGAQLHNPRLKQNGGGTPKNNVAGSAGKPQKSQPQALSYAEAMRHRVHERHDRTWWRTRYRTVVLVLGGYYYFDAGYWFPAWGFDPNYDTYDYDGPIYTYGNLLPDQVILNVQSTLKQLGYYTGNLNGSLSPATRDAISRFQQDNGLIVTGAIDAGTVQALGLE